MIIESGLIWLLTSSLEEAPVSRFPWPDSVEGWLTSEETWPSFSAALCSATSLDGCCGKMSPARFPLSEAPPSGPSSRRWMKSGMVWRGECLTLNTSECAASPELSRKDESVSSLWEVLETGEVQERYYLTAKAAAGILRRADAKKIRLPESYREMLERRKAE